MGLATPGLLYCAFAHFCMDGHMAHPPYAPADFAGDFAWLVLLGAAAIAASRSRIRRRKWLVVAIVFVLFGQFFVPLLNLLGLPVAFWLASNRSQKDATEGAPTCMKCDYDLTGNVSGICPECGTPTESCVTKS